MAAPTVITLDIRDAIARALRDLGSAADDPAPRLLAELQPDPKLRPGTAPGTYATSIAFGLSAIFRTTPAQVATRITSRLAAADWIAEAAVTGGGYVAITVTPQALAGVAARITAAGSACVRSDVLRGVTVPGPFPAAPQAAQTRGAAPSRESPYTWESPNTWEAAQTWEEGRAVLAAAARRATGGGGGRNSAAKRNGTGGGTGDGGTGDGTGDGGTDGGTGDGGTDGGTGDGWG